MIPKEMCTGMMGGKTCSSLRLLQTPPTNQGQGSVVVIVEGRGKYKASRSFERGKGRG